MKISVKTLKNNKFHLEVNPTDTIMDVKRLIEDLQGKEVFPCERQLLIYQGQVLTDDTTVDDNKVSEKGFLVVMLSKMKATPTSSSSAPAQDPTGTPAAPTLSRPSPALAPVSSPAGQAASNLVTGNSVEQTIQHLMDIGGGTWDRDTIVRALRAAYNSPERAVEYLYSGIPDTAEVAVPTARQSVPSQAAGPALAAAAQGTPPVGGNGAPLDLFPQGMPGIGGPGAVPGALDFLRNEAMFHRLRPMVQANPQILEPLLLEIGRQNPQLLQLLHENQPELLRLINEPGGEGEEGDLLGQLGGAMPQVQAINVTPEEMEAINRLEGMGFIRTRVIEAFLACDKNEQLAANYLLEHAGDNED